MHYGPCASKDMIKVRVRKIFEFQGVEGMSSGSVSGKRLVVVLGMHRSGTSAMARGLRVLGVNLGNKLIAGIKDDNDKGFWEDAEITSLNEEMLNSLGMKWSSLRYLMPEHIHMLLSEDYFQRALQLVSTKSADVPVFGFKDPRVAKLLPFWQSVFAQGGYQTSYVIALRNPVSVARSLLRRNKMPLSCGYYLWLQHVHNSIVHTKGDVRVICDFDRVMADARHELTRIATRLDLHLDEARLAEYQNDFLDELLRHSVASAEDLKNDPLSPPVVGMFHELLFLAARDAIDLDGQNVVGTLQRIHVACQ